MNIIITGASRGIGFEMVNKFLLTGNHTIAMIARSEKELLEIKEISQKKNAKSTIIPIAFDLSRVEAYEDDLVPRITNVFNSIDILINNAGYLVNKPFENQSVEDVLITIGVNLIAPIRLTQCLMPYYTKGCHIVNISSMGGFQGSQKFPGLSIYSSAKAGIACLTECLAEEYKDRNISFNCLALGATDTQMLREAFPGYTPPFSASEMADYIVDFALNKAKFFNGKIIPVSKSNP